MENTSSNETPSLYQPLDENKRQIRLLKLQPGSRDEEVRGTLVTIPLPKLPIDFDDAIYLQELEDIVCHIESAAQEGLPPSEAESKRFSVLQQSLLWLYRARAMYCLRCINGLYDEGCELSVALQILGTLSQQIMDSATRLLHYCQEMERKAAECRLIHPEGVNGMVLTSQADSADIELAVRLANCCSEFARIALVVEEGQDIPVPGVWLLALLAFLAPLDLDEDEILPWRYSAISWYWGDAAATENMVVNGTVIKAPGNTVRVLRGVRHPDRELKLWIDSICIDQSNTAERASQILLMCDIYSCAGETYAWLGEETERTVCALEYMSEKANRSRIISMIGGRNVDDIRSGHSAFNGDWPL